ncbi:hypothetical protein HRG84_18675 [Flavisolibacter sp. BT320]|nr:hypothetical protein [Flavisolibacter longurius]
MENRNNDKETSEARRGTETANVKNPFENKKTVESDIKESKDELENEQTFKEANTERD